MIKDPNWLAARRSLVVSEEAKQKLREANARQFSDPQARAHNAERTRQQWQDNRDSILEAQRIGRESMTDEQKREAAAKTGDWHRGRKRPPETGQRIAEAARKRWAEYTPERRQEVLGAIGRAVSDAAHGNSTIEKIVCDVLDEMGVEYERNFQIKRYNADIFIRSKMLIIECDGERWHKGREEKDAERDWRLVEQGYRVVRLPEDVIRSDGLLDAVESALS